MTTKTDICNVAAGYARQDTTIVDFATDTTVLAQRCRRFYDNAKSLVLSMYPWAFARSVINLATVDVTSIEGYTYVYAFPSQAYTLISVSPQGLNSADLIEGIDYAVFTSADLLSVEIHTNVEQAKAEIINKIPDETTFTPLFSNLLSALLSVNLAGVYKLSSEDMTAVTNNYAFIKNEAEIATANQEKRLVGEYNPYVEDRGN